MGERLPAGQDREGVEEAVAIGLITLKSNHFPNTSMAMTPPTVQASQITSTTTEEGMVYKDYNQKHQQVRLYTKVMFLNAALD